MASSSAHDVKDMKRLRQRTDKEAYHMPGLMAPKFVVCDRYGPTRKPSQVPLARALILFDIRLVHRVQRFQLKRASSTDGPRNAEAIDWVADCNYIRQQWKDINSGQCQFSELYMKSNDFVPVWTEGMRIIKEVLRSKQISGNQSKKRDDFARILTDYESLAVDLQTEMVDAAQQGLFEPEFFKPIQERWMRLDETVKLHYGICNLDVDEDTPFLPRRSLTWSEVRKLVQKPGNAAESDTKAGSKKVRASISWLAIFSCAVAPIPLFSLGYVRSTHLQGTANDADFWFLILAMLTQIQGLVVSALLEWKRGRLPKWRWAIPAAVAGACSIMAIPLYLNVPKAWSSFLSLVAGIIQSFMISQFFLF
ncbi:hypothetical protein BKA63DRAFT_558363 [Paraphoma chrysanthemicola]|nr:hypothetical protein BKA63DRAFT_558363 [Paraphoma chrysanthemicola]